MDDAELSRREFVQVGVASMATLPASVSPQIQGQRQTDAAPFQAVAVLEGPRDARPAVDSSFFDGPNRRRTYYAYRYIDEATKASWWTTQGLDQWHAEPLGAADVTDDDGHAVSMVTRDGALYVRRYD